MAKTLLYLIFLLSTFFVHAESNYDKALNSGVYEVNENINDPLKKHPFEHLHKPQGVTYERDPSDIFFHAYYVQAYLANRLNQYLQSKNHPHTVIYETEILKYIATYENDAISVTTTYKANNQQHSKIWFYKSSMPSISYALENSQAIKKYWSSGKQQSQEYFCSGVPVGYSKYFNEDGKLYGVIDWTQSDYETPINKIYTTRDNALVLVGSIYLNNDKSLDFSERLSTVFGPNVRGSLTLADLDVITFAETYQRHKLGMQHLRPLDNNTEQILRCPWLDEAMSYANENPQFALSVPEPISASDIKNDPRNQYESCVFNPSVDCLSHFSYEQIKINGNYNSLNRTHRIFTALEKKDELNQMLQIMRERGINPSSLDYEKNVNRQSDTFLKVRARTQKEIMQAEKSKDKIALIKTLRKPVYVEPLNVDLSNVDEINSYKSGADVDTFLLTMVSAAEVYADENQEGKARNLLEKIDQNMPKQEKLKGGRDTERINNIRAEMAITYSRLGMADLAEKQLSLIEYSDKPIIYDTYFAAYGWVSSALQLCRHGNLQKGRDFLSTGISMQKNNKLQISEIIKQAIDECKYPFDIKRVVGSNYSYPSDRDGFAGYPQMWSSYELYYKRDLPTQPIDFIDKQKRESEAKDGTNKSWIYQNYYSQKINTLFAKGQIKEAKQVADEYEDFVQAGSWYKFAPAIYTKVGRLRAKYGDCKGALISFNNAVLSLQLNKMNVDNSFVIRHPHYTLLPLISQGMAHCGASVEDVQKLQIDFDFSAPAETIQTNRRADEIEIEMAMSKSSNDFKSATEIVSKLAPTDLKINALVAIARQNPKNQVSMKPLLIKELNGFNQYFGMQLGAKEQRRAIGGFLEVLDMYFDKSDNKLSGYLTELGKQAEIIPQEQFKARAICQLGYLADKKQVVLDKNYFDLGTKISKNLSWAYGAPAGSCANWLKKAGRSNEAESLLNSNMATFRAYKTDPNNPNNWRKYAESPDLANAAFVYWEYEHGEMPSKYDEIMNYYQDSSGLTQAF